MGEYTRANALALRLIKKKGAPATLRTHAAGTPSTTPWAPGTQSSTDYSCYAVLTKFSEQLVDGDNIRIGDRLALVPASGLAGVPHPGDILVLGTDSWGIIKSDPVAPDGNPILYELQVRR